MFPAAFVLSCVVRGLANGRSPVTGALTGVYKEQAEGRKTVGAHKLTDRPKSDGRVCVNNS